MLAVYVELLLLRHLKTGRLLHYTAGSEVGHKGGTWATILDRTVFVTAVGWQPDIPPRLG